MIIKNHIIENINRDKSDNDCSFFIEELLSIYNSEKKLNLSLPVMILNAKTPKIANGLIKHLKFTQEHLLRLETLFSSLNEPIKN
ncbi:DUF892 family protein [Flavobacterium sp.]|uniref:DUF892 family protein n=1 Tax=Flavobacterium sp. TaxID=239 RepID=UPI00286DCD90|nr:DUF892 family protein [Flavobacterium sp.]